MSTVFNTEHFSPDLIHEAILCIVSNRSNDDVDPLSTHEYPSVHAIFVSTGSFYKTAKNFCAEIVLHQNKLYQDLLDEQHEDSPPFKELKAIYPHQSLEELELLWLMIVENWDEFRAKIERGKLEHLLREVA